ncbi:helix-turn-helix domain-containing protein [Streptomyces sp. UC1A3]
MTMTAQRPQRGRPRPQETIERDAAILRLLKENPDGMARNDIAEAMGLNKSRTYLSLDRLRRDGLAKMVRSETSQADKDALWVADEGA